MTKLIIAFIAVIVLHSFSKSDFQPKVHFYCLFILGYSGLNVTMQCIATNLIPMANKFIPCSLFLLSQCIHVNLPSLLLCGAFNRRQSNAVEDELKNSVGFLLQFVNSILLSLWVLFVIHICFNLDDNTRSHCSHRLQ